ncbi:MAG TPA: hypothetical protein VFI73_08965 [Candidatus Nitrosopolaris sp.]|nr:hypothetical protein [Candidatus Nitrosopolaris sp.]
MQVHDICRCNLKVWVTPAIYGKGNQTKDFIFVDGSYLPSHAQVLRELKIKRFGSNDD